MKGGEDRGEKLKKDSVLAGDELQLGPWELWSMTKLFISVSSGHQGLALLRSPLKRGVSCLARSILWRRRQGGVSSASLSTVELKGSGRIPA